MFAPNVDFGERFKRLTIGVAIGSLAFVGPESVLAGAVALYPLVTALVGRCPIYYWMDHSTSLLDDDHAEPPVAPAAPIVRTSTAAPAESNVARAA